MTTVREMSTLPLLVLLITIAFAIISPGEAALIGVLLLASLAVVWERQQRT